MNRAEIRLKINENNKIISQSLSPNVFILNNSVYELLKENKELQKQCEHEFKDGYCIYCDIMEENG